MISKDNLADIILFNPIPFNFKTDRGFIRKSTGNYLSLLSIAAPLVEAKYNVKIIDQTNTPEWQNELISSLKNKPICVGVTSITGTQIFYGLEASRIVRQNSDVPVVWGGIHPTLLPEQTIENEYIDIAVEGEGEETFFELVKALQQKSGFSQVKGIWYKENGKIKKTSARDFIDLNKQPLLSYFLSGRTERIHFFTSKGCPRRCAYCYSPTVNKRIWRALTADETLRRVKSLVDLVDKKYDFKPYIFFVDDDFFIGRERAKTIMEGLIKFNIKWHAHAHINSIFNVDNSFLSLMEKSGCTALWIGIESGSERILELMKKDISISNIISFNKRLSRFNIMPSYSFMLGLPSEALSDVKDTVNLFIQLLEENDKAIKSLNIYMPFPGNEMFKLAVKHGFNPPSQLIEWGKFNFKNINTPWIDNERKKLIEMLVFCSAFMEKKRFTKSFRRNKLFGIPGRIYRPIAKFRVKKNYYGFPFEIKLARRLGFLG